jgi:signal transduction histidine kinase
MVAAAEFFAARGVFGLVWIDRDLIVRRRFGAMAAFIPEGEPLTNALTPFIGSEDYILSFQQDPKLSLELPGVVIITSAETQDRFNLSLFWDPAQGCYFLLVARASLDATLELELVRHVRARLIAEADTTMKSKELMRANRDLEQFAAIVSHDLKAPMRALQYMTEDMEAAALRGDPIELQARLAQVRTQAQRMSSMLSGLLDYSTVGRKAMAIEDVDTGALARSVSGSIPHGTGMTIDVAGDWPVITTLKAPLDLVLRNLVDNAVKHHDKPTGKIRLECAPVGADVVISVIDNGPGIPPEHQASIFLPFRTLEAAGRPATGLGLGLALVQRTVESVGGRISLGGAGLDGRGTTFLVRWPAAIGASILLS